MLSDLVTALAVLVLLWAAVVLLFYVDGRYGGE
jgi:hypothetical protein